MILNNEEINLLFESELQNSLGQYGFEVNKGRIQRMTEAGLEAIYYDSVESIIDAKARLQYSACKRIDKVETVWQEFYTKVYTVGVSFDKQKIPTLAFNAARIKDYEYGISKRNWFQYIDRYIVDANEKGVLELSKQFVDIFKKYILPTFNLYNSESNLDRYINAKPETYWEVIHLTTGKGLLFKKIIASKMNKNPLYDQICEFVLNFIKERNDYQSQEDKEKHLLVLSEIMNC
ncbi:hypothetical protein L0P88_22800 [Muricauda sp. SCSIO 64092]|uniref:hypothetical protein n=1 Tax=Allomuricauda sp. SCSIO 64092 TaxID=2908842 RepID=UPI001FF11A50|nr:hypothetical protein [Muricauda sp. SCSIO 64092]UOY06737.1 hypothetical protein L0P88_22800 [Muricauda sp. SCSIO 64092]